MSVPTEGKTKKAEATRTLLIEAAERLIAQKGLENVSTREILQEAGQKNQSALQYHFGSKGGLIGATINERTLQLDSRRLELLNAIEGKPTLRQIIKVIVRPLLELIRNDAAGKNYLIFLSQAITRPNWDLAKIIEDFNIVGLGRSYTLYDEALPHLSEEDRTMRKQIGFDLAILTLKRWCMGEEKINYTLEEIEEFITKMTLAILTAE
ncbi:MAG: TetR/AcrR family transcriptional regulator [Kordiimonadaceae bacterium]|nr:TetR/AcrR family transcriptional regulator [Kordiimonadaceae bacterium]